MLLRHLLEAGWHWLAETSASHTDACGRQIEQVEWLPLVRFFSKSGANTGLFVPGTKVPADRRHWKDGCPLPVTGAVHMLALPFQDCLMVSAV